MAAKRTGRVSVARVIDEWGDHQSLNPRSLAFELADALRSMSQPGATVPTDKALIMGFADQEDAAELTWYALADYFDGFGSGSAPSRISTTNGECIPSALLLDRGWIDRLTAEAVARAEIAAGYAQALPHEPETMGSSALAHRHPAAPSGSDPECLAIREAQQRLDGEASAVEQLDAAHIARRAAEQEAERLRATLGAVEAQLHQERESIERLRREWSESDRARGKLAEQLAEEREARRMAEEEAAAIPARYQHLESALLQIVGMVNSKNPTPAQGVGITFPYATKDLEAMLAVAAKYWENYTADKRQPTQKEIALTLGELLGLPRQGNGDAARKAIVLASAIKPNALPDT